MDGSQGYAGQEGSQRDRKPSQNFMTMMSKFPSR